ncbi:SUKH-4 immunity protein of toxin-antitoxin system [Stackebrandtia albiflava]|uniref:SUKH-4 immunity protein of toxin-antitoxin system n=1 Tax=Stackebrandtia albiflava TaxID=406432 RepID=A0A562VC92_9ACTN|nr:SUKH-4 family immunity protein [Stackebrandtia albiflava]TWJ15505.1 SUKH-4 immunity protein of toxin-antitoxin system [Stackebrandtia albiflava]
MPLSDTDISTALTDDAHLGAPYPGRWNVPPYPDVDLAGGTGAVVADDPGISVLAVDRADGRLLLVTDDGVHPVNGSLSAFVACAREYLEARDAVTEIEDEGDAEWDEDGEEDAVAQIGLDLHRRFEAIDPVAVADENDFWAVAAEELGYGM